MIHLCTVSKRRKFLLYSIINASLLTKEGIVKIIQMKPYVIEVTTFQYDASVDAAEFWNEDAKIEAIYTSQQPGFISRESGYAEGDQEVVVVVRWKTQADADASMQKFMADASVQAYAGMLNGPSMKMSRYEVK